MTQLQKTKRRRDSMPAEKQMLSEAQERATAAEYRKRVRMLEARVDRLAAAVEWLEAGKRRGI